MTPSETPAWLERLHAEILVDPPLTELLTEPDLWGTHKGPLFRASSFLGQPSFYPVYRYQDYYSYSVLPLILKKGGLELNPRVAAMAASEGFLYTPTNETIDQDIVRVGGPVKGSNSLRDPEEYATRLSKALVADIHAAEQANPGTTNVILCGGRDSLNLLLLPWKNRSVVVSSTPNYELVGRFIVDNRLDLELLELEDFEDQAVMQHESLENACRTDLQHARWGAHLCRIAEEYERKVIFWKGQVADAFATPKWMVLTDPPGGWPAFWRKAYKRLHHLLPQPARVAISRQLLEQPFRRTIWQRCAMWQGSHVSMIRAITGCLTLSAYHGREVNRVFAEVDLPRAVPHDIRPEVGRQLHGQAPAYPTQNPSPAISSFRRGACLPARFVELLQGCGVRVTGQPRQ